jgi:hypothetical protein
VRSGFFGASLFPGWNWLFIPRSQGFGCPFLFFGLELVVHSLFAWGLAVHSSPSSEEMAVQSSKYNGYTKYSEIFAGGQKINKSKLDGLTMPFC